MRRLLRLLFLLFLLLVFVISVSFTYSNITPVQLRFAGLVFPPLPVSVLLAGAFVCGGLLGLLCGLRLFRQARAGLESRRLRRKLQDVEAEVARLRTLGLKEPD